MRMPLACLDGMNNEEEIRQVKETALHGALDELRGKEYDGMVKEIDEIQNKTKRAYVRLYEKVGEEIGGQFMNKLDHLSRQQTEADKLIGDY